MDQNEKDLGVALIDIGGGTTDILVYYDNGIQHSAAISYAGQNITLDIANRFQIGHTQAEELKHLHGTSKVELASDVINIEFEGVRGREASTISQKMLSEVIEPRMREILSLSYEEIKKSNISNKLNFGVVITGGGAQLENLIDLAQEVFNMPVKIGYPELVDNDTANYKDNPRYATAIGIIKYANTPRIDRISKVEPNRIKKIIKYLTNWY